MASAFDGTSVQTISILGAGWLGMPLAKALLDQGYTVKASTRSAAKHPEMEYLGIKPYSIRLLPGTEDLKTMQDFLEADLLIIAIPPTHHAEEMESYHPAQIQFMVDLLEKNKLSRVIYTSSTSVYRKNNQEVGEDGPFDESEGVHRAILLAEKLLMENPTFETTILRLAGLFGYDRIPGKSFAGFKNLKTGANRVNFIHRDDIISAIKLIIEKHCFGEIFNLVCPQHPTRETLYTTYGKKLGFEPPTFLPAERHDKIVSSQKIMNQLGFTFQYPDPLLFV